jgi:hypothetical protein
MRRCGETQHPSQLLEKMELTGGEPWRAKSKHEPSKIDQFLVAMR